MQADADGSGKLDMDEVAKFLHELNMGLDIRQVKMELKQFKQEVLFSVLSLSAERHSDLWAVAGATEWRH
jgi:hypothetical protein